MMFPETERMVLAIIVEYQQLAPILFENLTADDFEGDAKLIFKTIKERLEKKLFLDFSTLYDLLINEVSGVYISSMMDALMGIYPGEEQVLREKITFLKAEKGKHELLKEIDAYARLGRARDIDFDKIIELAQRGKFVQVKSEDSSFAAAYKEYIESKKTTPTQISMGFPSFDKLTGDFQRGEIIAIMARTTVGKTWLALNILSHLMAGVNRNDVGFFSLEMAKAPLIERMLQIHFDLSREELRKRIGDRNLGEEEFLKRYNSIKVYELVYSVAEIERLVKKDGLRIVFVDFLQLIKAGLGNTSYEITTNKIVDLKELAKNSGLTIFLLVQISRKGASGEEPVTIDMARESGAIEELSDFIVGVWDPSLNPGLDESHLAKYQGKLFMRLLKNKRGPTKFIEAKFLKDSRRIIEIDRAIV
jgi:KaiC/GvpD/RAD55 family RecA-like ATPase